MAVYAETILRNGTVWCGRAEGVAQAVALWGGRVLATGSDAEIAPLIGPDTRVIDLRGRLAIPALSTRICTSCLRARHAAGRRAPERADIDALVGVKARRALAPGTWILARGYDQSMVA